MTRSADISVAFLDKLDALEALVPEWAALEGATPEATGFQSPGWCLAWIRAAQKSGVDCRPRLLAVRDAGRLVMLWPLQLETRLGVTIVRWLGEPMTQYGDALAEPGAGRARWFEAAQSAFATWRDVDVYALTRLRDDSVVAAWGTPTGNLVQGEPLAAPFVNLRTPRRRQKSVERRAQRLREIGETALVEAASPAQREMFARQALELKDAWLKHKGLFSAGLSHAASADFLARAAHGGRLRVHALRVGADIAAIEIGFVGGNVYRSFLAAYDMRFAQGSPGQLLTQMMIERCASEGLIAYDMLLPADEYKRAWTNLETPVRAGFLPVTLKGRVASLALAKLRPLAKRILKAGSATLAIVFSARGSKKQSGRAKMPATAMKPFKREA